MPNKKNNYYYIPHITTFLASLIIATGILQLNKLSDFTFYIYLIFIQLISFIIMKSNLRIGRIIYFITCITIIFHYQITQIQRTDDFPIFYSMYLFFITFVTFLIGKPFNWIITIFLNISLYIKVFYFTGLDTFQSIIISIFSSLIIMVIILSKQYLDRSNREKIKSIEDTQDSAIRILGKVAELNDRETSYHLQRVEILTETIGVMLQKSHRYKKIITKEYIKVLKKAASLHDIGKIGISNHILNKEDKLTKSEYEEIKTHVKIGFNILNEANKEIDSENIFFNMAAIIAKYHHEKWDGSGYPEGLKKENIPLPARIMSIADVYDALISERPYKKALSHEKALKIIEKDSGIHFDPFLVDIFIKNNKEIKKKLLNIKV